MKTTRLATTLLLAALLAAAGCRHADRAISTPPGRAELPHLVGYEPVLPIDVGVEGAERGPQVLYVPRFDPIELTPEERAIIGEKEPPLPDELVFYRPPRGPGQGVSAEMFDMLIGIGGVDGAMIGHEDPTTRVGVFGFAGLHAYSFGAARRGAQLGPPRDRVTAVGNAWAVDIGENLPRTRARAADRRDY